MGKGSMSRSEGSSYDGEWYFDRMEGVGVFRWNNGDEYVGEWRMAACMVMEEKRWPLAKSMKENGVKIKPMDME